MRATRCVKPEYPWSLAALAQSPLAQSRLPWRSIITLGHRTTALITHRRTTATVTDGLGMTAGPVGRCRVEIAHPTKLRLAADGILGAAVHPLGRPTMFWATQSHTMAIGPAANGGGKISRYLVLQTPCRKLTSHDARVVTRLSAIEPSVRQPRDRCNADDESTNDCGGDQCFARLVTLPQAVQRAARSDYAEN